MDKLTDTDNACLINATTLVCFSDRYVIVGSHHSGLDGYSSPDWASGATVITALIQALMLKVKKGWQPHRTIIFCSWGETLFGNIGSYEWAEVRKHCPLQVPLLKSRQSQITTIVHINTRGKETWAESTLVCRSRGEHRVIALMQPRSPTSVLDFTNGIKMYVVGCY